MSCTEQGRFQSPPIHIKPPRIYFISRVGEHLVSNLIKRTAKRTNALALGERYVQIS